MKRYVFYIFFIVIFISFSYLNTLANVPMLINYQGYLTDDTGTSLDGDHNIQFSLYNSETSSEALWTEHQTVTVAEGVFNVQLGSGTASPLTSGIFENSALYLEIEIFINSTLSETLAPRQKITSSAFAIKAGDADTLGGFDPSTYDQSSHTMIVTGNPHGITANLIGALNTQTFTNHETSTSAHHTKTTSFGELTDSISVTQIPGEMATDDELDTEIANHNHDNRYYSQTHVDALEARITALESTVNNLLARFFGVTRNGDNITFSGVNVHIVNGTGTTDGAVNGLGNLIVGYNEPRGSGDSRTGSHNIVTGARNNYSSYGGLVAGNYNSISGDYSSVSGGNANTASGSYSSISGGTGSTASGLYASVSGGAINNAIGNYSSISGGGSNRATGLYSYIGGGGGSNEKYGNIAVADYSAILGGLNNLAGDGTRNYDSGLGRNVMTEAEVPNHSMGILATIGGGFANHAIGDSSNVGSGSYNDAIGNYSSVSGGSSNDAIGNASSVSGGQNNTASGESSSVSAGSQNVASEYYSSVSGGRDNNASAYASSVSGGNGNEASHNYSSVSGGRYNKATNRYSSVSGGYHNDASGEHSSVSGGYQRSVSGDEDWRAGDLFQDN